MVWTVPGLPELTSLWDSISKGIHTGIAGIADETNVDGGDVGEIDGSVDFDAALTGGVQILDKQATIRAHKSLKRTELNRFHHTKRIVGIMFRRSAAHKSWMVPLGLLISSVIPESVMRMAWPIFVLLGTHMGVKAARDGQTMFHKLVQKIVHKLHDQHASNTTHQDHNLKKRDIQKIFHKQVQKILHKLHDQHASNTTHQDHNLKKMVHHASDEDLLINAEIMGTLWELTRSDSFVAKSEVMGTYGIVMPLAMYTATRILLATEHYGYLLKSWGEDGLAEKTNNNLPLGWSRGYYAPIVLGKFFNKTAHGIFAALPWAGIVAKFITSGRTIAHAAPRISQVTAQVAATIGHSLPLISGEATAISWSFTSAAAVLCARTAYKLSHEPMRKIIDKNPRLIAWKTSAKDLLTKTSGSETAHLLRHTADNPLLVGRLFMHVGKRMRKPALI